MNEQWTRLRVLAEMYYDHQRTRISQQNRLRSATVAADDLSAYIAAEEASETQLGKQLAALYRNVAPATVVKWADETLGVGDKLLARLLGHLGHPRLAAPLYWVTNPKLDESERGTAENPRRALHAAEPFERSIGQLWQYCGHGRAERRRAGMTQEEAMALGSPQLKMLTHLLAESVIKQQVRSKNRPAPVPIGPLGAFYLNEKAKYVSRVHTKPCSGGYVSAGPGKVLFAKCKLSAATVESKTHCPNDAELLPLPPIVNPQPIMGSSSNGKVFYAQAGDPYSPGHINAIAVRHLGKQILRELWLACE